MPYFGYSDKKDRKIPRIERVRDGSLGELIYSNRDEKGMMILCPSCPSIGYHENGRYGTFSLERDPAPIIGPNVYSLWQF